METQLKITQVKSSIRTLQHQKRTLEALGLRGVRKSVVQRKTPTLEGMLKNVLHLVKIEEVK